MSLVRYLHSKVSVVTETGFEFVLGESGDHMGEIGEKVIVVSWMIVQMGLVENVPDSYPALKRVDLHFFV